MNQLYLVHGKQYFLHENALNFHFHRSFQVLFYDSVDLMSVAVRSALKPLLPGERGSLLPGEKKAIKAGSDFVQ